MVLLLVTTLMIMLATMLVAGAPAGAATLDYGMTPQRARDEYRAALRDLYAVRLNDFETRLARLESYPLLPYLHYARLMRYISRATPEKIAAFRTRFAGTLLAERALLEWLDNLASRGEWQTFLDAFDPTLAHSAELRCHHARALQATGAAEAAAQAARELWLVDYSQPKACDAVFDAWRRAGGITDELAWQRFDLALQAGRAGLASYLTRALSPESRTLAEQYLALHRSPHRLIGLQRIAGGDAGPREMRVVAHAVRRLARRDATLAAQQWERWSEHLPFTDAERSLVREDLVRHSARQELLPPGFVSAWPPADLIAGTAADLIEELTRDAIRERRWSDVDAWVGRLPDWAREQPAWRYWSARARIETSSAPGAEVASAVTPALAPALGSGLGSGVTPQPSSASASASASAPASSPGTTQDAGAPGAGAPPPSPARSAPSASRTASGTPFLLSDSRDGFDDQSGRDQNGHAAATTASSGTGSGASSGASPDAPPDAPADPASDAAPDAREPTTAATVIATAAPTVRSAPRATPVQGAARDELARLAETRTFYGFMAAQRSGRPFALERASVDLDAEEVRAIATHPAMRRALELDAIGERVQGRREIGWLMDQLGDRELLALAEHARRIGWHRHSIQATIKAEHWNHLDLRFPLAYAEPMLDNASRRNLQPSWLFAVARQESAFMEDARSSAGALGLMQVLPSTAEITARRFNIPLGSSYELLDERKNIQIGASYLRQMYDRYDENRILASAAYNAGPGRVDRWIIERDPNPADQWIETIPFNETRNYVQNVLAFALIYSVQLGEEQPFLYDNEQ